jgi:ligand-binding SRPBCC domain-containing protein
LRREYKLIREQWVPQTIDAAFAFFSRPANLQAITPAWLDFRIVSVEAELRTGSLIQYRLHWHGVPLRWTTEITAWEPPHSFIDNQVSGPYTLWRHEHRLTPENGGTRIRDEVTYALPLGVLGRIVHPLLVRRDVEAIFDFRQHRLKELLG